MKSGHVEVVREALLAQGYYLVKGLYDEPEVDAYRESCESILRTGKAYYCRINSDAVDDYVQPRSHNADGRATTSTRIYQYFHNHKNDETGRFWAKAMDLRRDVEAAWMAEAVFRREMESQQSFCVVTRYDQETGNLPLHSDYHGPCRLPLIQLLVLLSRPGVDYREGNLALIDKQGHRWRIESDLGFDKGDAVLFDKALYHEVEKAEPVDGSSTGRWTAAIGAKAPLDSAWNVWRKRMRYGSLGYRLETKARHMRRTLRSMGLPQPSGPLR